MSELQLEMEKIIKITMVLNTASKLSLKEIMTVMIKETDEKPTWSQVHASIMQSFPECDFKKTSGHKDQSVIGSYRLRWIYGDEKRAAASVLLCVGTTFEGTMLSRLVKMPENLDLQDPDIKVARIGFLPDFTRIIVLGEPSGPGGYPMYEMTKLLVGILPNLEHAYKTGSCTVCLDMGIIIIVTNNSDGVMCEDPCLSTLSV